MKLISKERLKDALISILIGSVITFLTVFLEGMLDILKDTENNLVGGAVTSLWYAIKHIT